MTGAGNDPIAELKARTPKVDGLCVKYAIDNETLVVGDGEPQATVSMSKVSLEKMLAGDADGASLFMTGDLKIDGDMNAAIGLWQAQQATEDTDSSEDTEIVPAGDKNDDILFLDNVALIVNDLDTTRDRFKALGFNLAARGNHYAEHPAGEFHRWGTGNHCANFRDGSMLELIGHYHKDYTVGLYGTTLRAFGDHWGKITLHVSSADKEQDRLEQQGIKPSGTAIFYRYTDGEEFEPTPMKSKRSILYSYPVELDDGIQLIGTTHTLGEFPMPDEHFQHPNGAIRLTTAVMAADDVGALIARLETSLSIKAEDTALGRSIPVGRGSSILVLAKSDLPDRLKDHLGSRERGLVAARFEVQSLSETQDCLTSAGVSTTQTDLGLMVPEPINGAGAVVFHEAD
ncbi:MAG: VOC family protein [Pseudomonadota bacterium]